MAFFVYWDKGCCNDGDHSTGLEEFDTAKEALEKIKEIKQYNFFNGYITMIEGETVEQVGDEYQV